ncbi:hypothetical protein FO441_10065 [Salinicoccus cyprini]|uniref:Uncharacterized protein n=1 Tax=Salinicoccus cyprini TaxID=2493691 RepID=A0A558ASY8_9STAP|nr:hypothetical protein [Salinicoccus cyprini]TVT27377.1 hypothetical protein FO441_10065 [Salinicoccus cyprini]
MNNDEKKVGFIDTGLLIVILTAISYFIAYSYETAYLSYFGFSEFSVLSVSITSLVTSLGTMVIIIIFLTLSFIGFKANIKFINSPIFKLLSKFSLFFFLILLSSLFFKFQYLYVFLSLTLILLIRIYGYPYYKYKETKGYMNKIKKNIKDIESRSQDNIGNIYLSWNSSIIGKLITIVLIFIFAFSISNILGYYAGLSKEKFYITEIDNRELVVFKIYGDNAVVAPFNTETAEYSNSIIVMNIKSDNNDVIEFEKRTFDDGIKVRD